MLSSFIRSVAVRFTFLYTFRHVHFQFSLSCWAFTFTFRLRFFCTYGSSVVLPTATRLVSCNLSHYSHFRRFKEFLVSSLTEIL